MKVEDNFLFMGSVVSYLLQSNLSEFFGFNLFFTYVSGEILGSKYMYECDPPEDGCSPSSFLSAS